MSGSNNITNKNIFIGIIISICSFLIFKFIFKSGNNSKKTYIENIGMDVTSLNPHIMNDGTSIRVGYDIYEGLLSFNNSGKLVNTGCKSYEVSQDNMTIVFHLRENVKWANGDNLTAEDYVYSLRRAVDPKTLATGFSGNLNDIKNAKTIMNGNLNKEELGVFADDKYTLRIELENPNSEFINYLTLPIFYPIHKNTVEKYGISSFSKPETIMCNGPYKIKKLVHNDNIILEKNENYWDKDNVKIEKVKFLMIADGSVDLNTFRTGHEHMTYYNIPTRDKSEYIKEFGDKYKNYTILCQYKLFFNLNLDKYKDIRVRKALNIAMDRENLCNKVIKTAKPSYSVIHENIHNNEFEKDIDDLEEYSWVKLSIGEKNKMAKELLLEVGYSKENPLVIEILSRSDELHKNIASAIQDIYNKAFDGLVKCKLVFNDVATWLNQLKKGDYDMSVARWGADYNLVTNYSMLLISDNSMNFGRYSNNDVDELFYDSFKFSPEEYIEKQHELIKIAALDYPIVPFAKLSRQRLVSDKITGYDFENNILDRYSTKYLRFKD